MKKILALVTSSLITATVFAQTKIPVDSASKHIGEKVVVCSEVYGVKSLDKVTFINLGASYPNSPLTIVIFAKDRPNFKESPEKLYGNQPICVTGELKEYKGKAEIIVERPDEIVVGNSK
jgi:DNA/RNA endonuclease YhcR with UshA esterase domain